MDLYYVHVMGMAVKGMGAAGEESWCEHVAYLFSTGGYVANGGAAKIGEMAGCGYILDLDS